MSRGPRVLVLGGGIAGTCAALALRARGADVSVLAAERAGAATRSSAGLLAPQYESSADSALFGIGIEARARYPEWLARLEGAAGRRVPRGTPGMLVALRTPAEREAAAAEAARQRDADLPAEPMGARDAARLEPGLAPDVGSWLWLPGAGWVDAAALADALAAALGGSIVRPAPGNEAAGIESRRGRVRGVRLTDGGFLEADVVVVACGAWSGRLDGLPRALPVRPVRGQILRFPASAPAPGRLLADPGGRYLVPRGPQGMLAGSTMEEAGFDASPTPEGRRAILTAAMALVPALAGAEPEAAWAGLRPVTPDGLPILGPDPELEGLVYATGYGRNGILLGPLAGEAAADAALDRPLAPPWAGFGPRRPAPGSG